MRRTLVFSLALLLVPLPALAIFDDVINFFEDLADVGRSAWGTVSGSLVEGTRVIGNVIVDDVGQPIGYEVVRGVRPIGRVAPEAFKKVGSTIEVSFNQGLDGAADLGKVVIDETGNVAVVAGNAVASGVVTGAEYAYEGGTFVVKNLASFDCETVLAFGGKDLSYSVDRRNRASADCAKNIGIGFACAVPSSVYDLINMSEQWYQEVKKGANSSPCTSVPIPPANYACGLISRSNNQVQALAQCILNLENLQPPGGSFGSAQCRSIGSIIFSTILSIATGGGNSASTIRRVAQAVKQIYEINDTVESIEEMVKTVCGGLTAQLAPGSAPNVDAVTLFQDADYKGASLPLTSSLATLPAGFQTTVSSIALPPNMTIAAFSEVNFAGTCDTFSTSIPSTRRSNAGNDRISSIRVDEVCPGTPVAQLFQDGGYRGRVITVAEDMWDLNAVGFGKRASSIRLLGNTPVALYSEPGYGGNCVTVSASLSSIATTPLGNDAARSLRVNARCPQAQLELFANSGYGGTRWPVFGDIRDNQAAPSDNASSLRLVGGRPVALYLGRNFTGACLTVRGDMTRFPTGWGDQIASVRVNATCDYDESPGAAMALVSGGNRCFTTVPKTQAELGECAAACGTNGACFMACANTEAVVATDCTGSARQAWTFAGDHLQNAIGQCITTPSAGSLHRPLVASPCVRDSNEQRFVFKGRSLVTYVGRCVTVPVGGLFMDQTPVQTGPCDGHPSQIIQGIVGPHIRATAQLDDAALVCPFDVAGDSGLVCRSGAEALTLPLLPGEFFTHDPDVAPLSGRLTAPRRAGANGPTALGLPARIAHDPLSESFTLSTWVRPLSAADAVVVAKGNATDLAAGYSLRIAGGVFVASASDGARVVQARAATPLTLGAWVLMGLVIDRAAGELRLTANGTVVATTALEGLGEVRAREGVSVRGVGNQRFMGDLDELRLYRRLLTPNVAAALLEAAPRTNLARAPGVTVRQPSTDSGGYAPYAVDGDRNPHGPDGSVQATAGGWFEVDFGAPTEVADVLLFNRRDARTEGLNGVAVTVQATPCDATTTVVARRAAVMDFREWVPLRFPAGTVGRYLCTRRSGLLQMAELEVYGPDRVTQRPIASNLARLPEARVQMSSSTTRFGLEAAVDGQRLIRFDSMSTAHTAGAGYIEVDLGSRRAVDGITFTTRRECCTERNPAMRVELRDTPCDAQGAPTFAPPTPPTANGERFTVRFTPHETSGSALGRYVCIRSSLAMNIPEFDISGPWQAPPEANVALHPLTEARQTSQYEHGAATRGIDGRRSAAWSDWTVLHTSGAGFVEIRLPARVRVGQVAVFNRADSSRERLDAQRVELRTVPCDQGTSVVAQQPAATGSAFVSWHDFQGAEASVVCVRGPMVNLSEIEVYPRPGT